MDITIEAGLEKTGVDLVMSSTPPFIVSFTHIPFDCMGVGDCTREIKCCSLNELYKREGMHGSAGSWKKIDMSQAVEWLLDAALNNYKVLGSHERCNYSLRETDNKCPL